MGKAALSTLRGPPALDSAVHPNGTSENCIFTFQHKLFWEIRFIVSMLIKMAKLFWRLQT